MGLHQGPVNVSIKASLSGKNGFFNTVKKGKLSSPDFMMLSGSRIKETGQNMRCTASLFVHSIVKNVMKIGK